MEQEIDFSTMPRDYVVCWHANCPMAHDCLRRLATEHLPEGMRLVTSVNLRTVSPVSGHCREQRRDEPHLSQRARVRQREDIPRNMVGTGQHDVLPLREWQAPHHARGAGCRRDGFPPAGLHGARGLRPSRGGPGMVAHRGLPKEKMALHGNVNGLPLLCRPITTISKNW